MSNFGVQGLMVGVEVDCGADACVTSEKLESHMARVSGRDRVRCMS